MWLWDNRSKIPLDLPVDFAVLRDGYKSIWITDAIDFAITGGDLPAVHELIRLLGPDVLYLCDMGEESENLTPTALNLAAESGHVDILTVLLDYRDSLPPDERDRREAAYERDELAMDDPFQRPWGTPLTTACMAGHADAVQLLLARMPEVDVNASDKFGYTPLQSVARCALSAGPDRPHMDPDEPARRIAIVKMLLAKGAVPRATDGRPELHFRYTGRAAQPDPLVLTLMADRGQGDSALTRFFIDKVGIDVHAGFSWCTARMDGRGVNGVADEDVNGYDVTATNDINVYLTPLAMGALFGNAAGVETLLRTPNTTFAADLVPATGLPPLHAAMVGLPTLKAAIREPGGPEPSYQRPIRFFHDNKVLLVVNGQMNRSLSDKEREAYWAANKAATVTDRAAYIDARVATVQLLVAEAASVCKSFNINATHAGCTPLHLGARFDCLPLLRVLLDRGADPRIPLPGPGGRSVFAAIVASIHRLCVAQWSRVANDQPWYSAGGTRCTDYNAVVQSIDARVGEGMTALLRELMGDSSVNEADADGNTALHWTMGYSLPSATKALLALGARPDALNHAGEVPTDGTVPTTRRTPADFREYD
ncbi:hypothetical protein SEUCBS139899_003470 [Sporothrix eucalyptigena]|uniref:Ankyrin repeat protein n=1 Tax=Sporothrix eucalyptigena TaxID=1812306 RepID=A0ABP0AP99_9PEZI